MTNRVDDSNYAECKKAFPSPFEDGHVSGSDVGKPKLAGLQEELANEWKLSGPSFVRWSEAGEKCSEIINSHNKEEEANKRFAQEKADTLSGSRDVIVDGILQGFDAIGLYPEHSNPPSKNDREIIDGLKAKFPDLKFSEMTPEEIKQVPKGKIGFSTIDHFNWNANSNNWLVVTDLQSTKGNSLK